MSDDPGRDVLIENLEDTLTTYADDPDAHNVTDVVRDIVMQITDYLLKGTQR